MAVQYTSVEDLSRKLEGQRKIIIQEVTDHQQRQWVFEGERLRNLKEQHWQPEELGQTDEVIFVCDDLDRCQELASQVKGEVQVGFLAGGYLAWGQFYHPVLVGMDGDLKVWQIHRLAKGCLSYLIASGQEAVVIDPCYHIDYYLGLAHSQKTDITCVIDTQVHTDHVSGGPRLAAETNSPYYLPSHDGLKADSLPLEKESTIEVNGARLKVIPISSQQAKERVLLCLNEQYLFVGDTPFETVKETLSAQGLSEKLDRTALILPAHLRTWGKVDAHGIVAATWEQLADRKASQPAGQTVSLSQPQVKEEEILRINLAQREIDLDQANQLELGLEHTP